MQFSEVSDSINTYCMSYFSSTRVRVIVAALAFISIVASVYIIVYNPLRRIHINSKIQTQQNRKNTRFQNTIEQFEEYSSQQFKDYPKNPKINVSQIANHAKLFRMYCDGVPDQYDADNNIIKGIEPDPQRAIHHIRQGIRCGWGRWGLFELV